MPRKQIAVLDEAQISQAALSFHDLLQAALIHYRDARWLGEYSPLASPYILGRYSSTGKYDAEDRGIALQKLLAQALSQINSGNDTERHRLLVSERFFEGKDVKEIRVPKGKKRENSGDTKEKFLKKVQIHEHLNRAIVALEHSFIHLLNPALRLESPVQLKRQLSGRQPEASECWKALLQGETRLITGGEGLGKTSFAASLAHRWGEARTFWFTIRPGLNDQVDSLLFSLAYFFLHRGEPALWSHLQGQASQAESNTIDRSSIALSEQTLSMIRHALVALAERGEQTLLCFDEMDRLNPLKDEEHKRIRELIRSLISLTPMLLIGTQIAMDAPYCEMTRLSHRESEQLLKAAGVTLSPRDHEQLYKYTQGNPRLLELCIALISGNHSPNADPEPNNHLADPNPPDLSLTPFLSALNQDHSLEALLERILEYLHRDEWRLGAKQLEILYQLSVYLAPAPADLWQTKQMAIALEALLQRNLIHVDQRGGIFLLPAYRNYIYQNKLTHEQRKQLHRQAAYQLHQRAIHSEALHHRQLAGESLQVLLEWEKYKFQELNQGQGGMAHQILNKVYSEAQELDQTERELARKQLAELKRFLGDLPGAEALLRLSPIRNPTLAVEGKQLEAMLDNDRSRLDQARQNFHEALAIANEIIEARVATIHKGLAWMHMRSGDLDTALREAQLARFEADYIQGVIYEQRCEYATAEQYNLSALDLAEKLGYREGIAKSSMNLGAGIYTRLGRFAEAEELLQKAEQMYREIHKLSDLFASKINRAFLYNLAGRYTDAVEALQETQKSFLQTGLSIPAALSAIISQGLAEAYLGLKDLESAQEWVTQALKEEEGSVLADSFRTWGEICLDKGETADAEKHILRSLHYTDEMADLYLKGFSLRALARVYKAQGRLQEYEQVKEQTVAIFQTIHLPNEVQKTEAI